MGSSEVRKLMDIPRDKNHPADAVQCDECGGHGCAVCGGRGWLPAGHARGRLCEYEKCRRPLAPGHVAVYCSNECAFKDAGNSYA